MSPTTDAPPRCDLIIPMIATIRPSPPAMAASVIKAFQLFVPPDSFPVTYVTMPLCGSRSRSQRTALHAAPKKPAITAIPPTELVEVRPYNRLLTPASRPRETSDDPIGE